METRMLGPIIQVLDDSVIDGLMVPPVSYLRNAREASATKMMDNTRISLIQPIQHIFKKKIERELFAPYLAGLGYGDYHTPSIDFMPPTEEEVKNKTEHVLKLYAPAPNIAGFIDRDEARSQLNIKEPTQTPPEEEEVEGVSPLPISNSDVLKKTIPP